MLMTLQKTTNLDAVRLVLGRAAPAGRHTGYLESLSTCLLLLRSRFPVELLSVFPFPRSRPSMQSILLRKPWLPPY